MEWILGTTMGAMVMAMLSSGRHSELDNEIISLRLQRKMLKDEILKKRKPYKKKKYYKNKKRK